MFIKFSIQEKTILKLGTRRNNGSKQNLHQHHEITTKNDYYFYSPTQRSKQNTRFALVNKQGDTKKNCCPQINATTIPVLLIPVKHLKKGTIELKTILKVTRSMCFASSTLIHCNIILKQEIKAKVNKIIMTY